MATHFVCQATEPIPHKFPTSRNPEKGHGAVSQYEVLNLSPKKHTDFPPAGWDTSESSEDSLPLCQAPAPVWKVPSNLIGPDPDLCVTPERGLTNKKTPHISGLSKPPVPTQSKLDSFIGPDPELCITPEKNLASHIQEQKSNLKHEGDLNLKSKKSHRVRFDVDEVNEKKTGEMVYETDTYNKSGSYGHLSQQSGINKPYKPLSYSDQDIDLDDDDDFIFAKSKPNKHIMADYENTKHFAFSMKDDGKDSGIEICDKAFSKENEIDDGYVPVLPEVLADSAPVIDVSPDLSTVKLKSDKKSKQTDKSASESAIPKVPSGSKRKVKVKRESHKGQLSKEYVYPFEEGGDSLLEYEHVFARPEYNSTLRIRSEIEQMKGSSVDMSKALEKKLKISDTKVQINEKAATRVNTDSQFSGLVSLEVPLENLCSSAEKQVEEKWRSVKQTAPKSRSTKGKEVKGQKEPDLLEFFTPDLQRETVELSVPSPSTPSETLATADHMTAFDLYRHNRVWDSSTNFRIGK